MEMINLHSFGFDCRFNYRGRITKKRETGTRLGTRLLFLLNERHTGPTAYEMKRLNLLNACALCKLGVVGLVGVEGKLPDCIPPDNAEQSAELIQHHGGEEGAVEHLYRVCPDNSFGMVLRQVFPSIPVRSIEDPQLYERTNTLFEQYKVQSFKEQPVQKANEEFETHAYNLERDKVFIKNLIAFWEEAGVDKAAILNAGRSHLDRIVAWLPDDVRYIQMETEAAQV